MGWLWNETHHMFDSDDGSFPEICICGLSADQVSDGYLFIREKAQFTVGTPCFFNCETRREMDLSEAENPARLVCEKKANPFHFMTRNIRYEPGCVHELGIFIFDNAIALDYEKGPIWGEREIETLFQIILKIKGTGTAAFIKLEKSTKETDRQIFAKALDHLATSSDN